MCAGGWQNAPHFNPRTPYGVRRQEEMTLGEGKKFQSTHPIRGATPAFRRPPRCRYFNPRTPYGVRPADTGKRKDHHGISIHAPHTGCDLLVSPDLEAEAFQSTHPIRGATRKGGVHVVCHVISIHAPHTGCDGKFDDFNPLNLHKRYKRVLDRPKSTSEQGKNKAKLAYIHVFTVFGGCEGAGTVCALLLRTQYC